MERWVLEGDSYSFLRSAPHTFNLQNREGPNRVEIFDITSIPSHRNAISETTCLCDIFGDDGESQSLSSSPASATYARKEIEQPFSADDANDSGSYHTANGSDLSDNAEVTYSTPSPKNTQDFCTSENSKTDSPPPESTILPGLNAFDCIPPAPKENGNDLSHKDYWEEPQVSVSPAPVNETDATEPHDINSTPDTCLINSSKETSNPTSCSSEQNEAAVLKKEVNITTPQHTGASPFEDEQGCISISKFTSCEDLAESKIEQDIGMSLESKKGIDYNNPQEERVLLAQKIVNSGSASELSNTSPTDCISIQEMSISPADQDICYTPEHRLSSVSPDSRTISSTPASIGRSSPELLDLCSTQSESPLLENSHGASSSSTIPTNDEVKIDSTTESDISTERRGLVCSSMDGRERLESPGFNEICSSPEQSAYTHTPVPVIIHSPIGYTINASPTNETTVSSSEHEALLSSPVVTRTEYSDICSSPDHSESIIDSPLGYTISPSPTNEREVYSTEPETSISPCCHSDIYSTSDVSVSAHSPEPTAIHSPMGFTISPSPTNQRMVYSMEPDDQLSSPALTGTDYIATPIYSRDSTPELRSITSTPNSGENYLTPEPTSSAPSPELSSDTCLPEIKTVSYSILPLNTKSPMIEGIDYNISPSKELAQSSAVDTTVCSNSSVASNSPFENYTSVSPSSRNILSTPESRSRPSSNASEHTRDTGLSPESSMPIEKTENQPSPIIIEGINPPSHSPIDSHHLNDHVEADTFKSSTSVQDEYTGGGPEVLSLLEKLEDSSCELSDSALSTVSIDKNQEIVTDNTTSVSVCGTSASLSPSDAITLASVEEKQYHCNIDDHDKRIETLKNDSPSSNQVTAEIREMLVVINRDNVGEFDSKEKVESGKREGEGEETMGDSSYRGEQVELSFSARNRKGHADYSPALSSRDPKSGIPARCYFESPPTTLQQQSQLRARGSHQENKSGARSLRSAAVQGKYRGTGFFPPECTGENSIMGSEFDETDNEVKWFTDLAFRSLSSPQVDYLDVYNSSHRSSTNVSQPSTVDSPGAVAWMSYADLRGSVLHENNSYAFLPRDGLDPNKHFEMGNFECVDVALESKEESNKGKRTVPKRQIQLLRRNTDEAKPNGNTENVSTSPSTHRHSRDTIVRQHSTPVFVQEKVFREVPNSPQSDRKRTLQKSVSLDDGSPKTQMASCIIKSVLSKRMQDVQKATPKSSEPSFSGDKNNHDDISPSSFDDVPINTEKHSLSSSQLSECTLLSEEFVIREERIPHQVKKCAPKVPPKPLFRPAFLNTDEALIADNFTNEETKPIVASPPADEKVLVKHNNKADGREGGGDNHVEENNSDSANASVRNSSPATATPAISMQNKITNRDKKHQMTTENQEQLAPKSVFMSKTPEITLKPSSIKGKKTSLKVSLSPDLEQSREISETTSVEKAPEDMSTRCTKAMEMEEVDDINKKSVIHKVRDVRKLVKNTYNLSFTASNSTSTAEEIVVQEKKEKPPQTPPALHIECKAISWKDKQTPCSKAIQWHDEKQPVDISKISQPRVGAETRRDADITEIPSKVTSLDTEPQQKTADSLSATIDASESITKRPYVYCDQSAKMPPRPPSKEREVSAVVVLPNITPKAKTFDTSIPASIQMKGTNSSHSVSMLLKEKGMQADIGVCDVHSEGASSRAKHINRLEVPVQACLSEGILNEAQVRADNSAVPCNSSVLVNNYSRTARQSESPKGTLSEESSTKEQEKKKITTTVTKIPTYLATSGKPEVRSFSSNTKNNATTTNTSKEIELPIQVRSVSTDKVKPFVTPKLSCKQSFAEIKSVSSDPPKAEKQASSVIKQQTRLCSDSKKIESQSTLIHKDQSHDASSKDTKRLAVSAISSYKPPTTTSTVQKSTTVTLASPVHQQSSADLQTTSTCQQQASSFNQDHSVLDGSFASNQSGSQILGDPQSVARASSNNRFHTDDYLFYASDDPPSYDERESFSPLRVSDLLPQRPCKYHPSTKQSPCSCPQGPQSHQGHTHHSPLERVPVASRSPGQVQTCPGAPPQAQVRPHQCRPDGLPVSNTTVPHASAMIQPLHNPRACPVSNSQSYVNEQPPTSGLHAERRPANHPSPKAAAPASYHEYSHSSNMSAVDPRSQLFNPQDLPPSFGHDYANEGPGGAGVLYPENASGLSCGQGPRRVLLDPETGKYFYIEVPMQPLRKMLFDPELGQYVEVLIPQQTMSHSGLYPPAVPPYSSLHNPGLYAPQYLPYAMPSFPAIPGNVQQVRHPEPPPVPTTLHQTALRYGSPGGQMPKNEAKGHSLLDQGYLESMYYMPTGMNASPNSTASDCYHKPSSSMPPSGGRRA
ncbi:uncharacterized protein si:ch73-43g23.1 [Danio aesculapii]|uniref:uncharacterized protein si:ch73-43g23.1 n=1 Tax=Danio aesculapii TaxID=1142201 RepID=UPI0024C01CA1|nr:uncharacterized protein si:ch73-43g23.1 [Danio aesculapii]